MAEAMGNEIRPLSGASAIHGAAYVYTNRKFNPTISAALPHANHYTQARFANSPMRVRSLVKRIKGITAKGNCMLRITWLKIRSL